jgi:hypothetical protein
VRKTEESIEWLDGQRVLGRARLQAARFPTSAADMAQAMPFADPVDGTAQAVRFPIPAVDTAKAVPFPDSIENSITDS